MWVRFACALLLLLLLLLMRMKCSGPGVGISYPGGAVAQCVTTPLLGRGWVECFVPPTCEQSERARRGGEEARSKEQTGKAKRPTGSPESTGAADHGNTTRMVHSCMLHAATCPSNKD